MRSAPQVDRSISVIMPALNEEENLANAVAAVQSVVAGRSQQHEILIFDDGSTDRTGEIAEALAKAHREIHVVHHERPRGLGYCYRRGAGLATCEHIVMVPGDNEVPAGSLATIFAQIGAADIVVPYFTNASIRPRSRQLVSRAFTGLVNTLFGLNLRYFNGPCIHRRALAQSAMPNTSGFAYMAVLLVRLVRSGCRFKEVGIELGPRSGGRSKAFRLKNVMSVGLSLVSLVIETRVIGRRWGVSAPISSPDAAR